MVNRKNPSVFDCSGATTTGGHYSSIVEMWKSELAPPQPSAMSANPSDLTSSGIKRPRSESETDQPWYSKSARYWQQQPPSIEGMLGGLGKLDARDVAASRKFLEGLWRRVQPSGKSVALDVGAGIGRVTKHLLLPIFETVDMLDQNPDYLRKSVAFIGEDSKGGQVGKRIACGMQEFNAHGLVGADGVHSGSLVARYDLIWIQWCINYLTDEDLVRFLRQCCKCLLPGGIIGLKDNVVRSGFLIDKDDSSIMRSDKYLKHLFSKAQIEVIRETKQLDFPRDIFPVRIYALRPTPQPPEDLGEGEPFQKREEKKGILPEKHNSQKSLKQIQYTEKSFESNVNGELLRQ